MANASLVPSLDADIHLVLCRFGRAGLAYIETDPAEADATTVVQNLLHGRYGWPLRVIALNVDEGWSRDVSEAMARKVHEIASVKITNSRKGRWPSWRRTARGSFSRPCPYGEYDAYRTSPRSLNARHSFITAWQTAPVRSIAAAPTRSASRLISGEQWPSPNRARACRRSYSPSERPVMVPRASGIGRLASRAIGPGSRSLSSLRIAS